MGELKHELSLERTMDRLKGEIIECHKNKDYPTLIAKIEQFQTAQYVVEVMKMHGLNSLSATDRAKEVVENLAYQLNLNP